MLTSLHHRLMARPGALLLVALLVTAPATWLSAHLFSNLRADLKELLPGNAPAVLTLRELERRFGGWSSLSIVVESPDREANRRFSDDLVGALTGHELIRSVKNKVGPERDFFERHRFLFVDLGDLEEIAERIEDAANDARARANPLLVDLEDREPTKLDFADIEEKYAARLASAERFPERYYENDDGTQNVVQIRQRGLSFGIKRNKQVLALVEAKIRELDPARYHPSMVTGLSGDVKNIVDEQESLVEDLITATVIVFALLGVVVVVYYRRWRSLFLLAVPVTVGTLLTFGVSDLLIGYLNASSAFLIPIIPGNGINFGLILLARYIEERRAGVSVEAACDVAVRHSAQGTVMASTAASIAYGSLIVTDFLGFKHFGIIGGIGMLFCWLTTFTVLPALILWTERRFPMDPARELKLYPPGALAAIPGRIVAAAPRTLAWGGLATGVAAAVACALYLRDPFEKDFNKLRTTDTHERGAAFWAAKVDAIFKRWLSTQVVIVEDPADAAHVVAHLRKAIDAGGERAPITDVTSLGSLVPADQEAKLEVLARIRGLLSDDLLANLDAPTRKRALEYRPPADLAAFGVKDLPEEIRAEFRELDGTEGRVVLVTPNIKLNLYHADEVGRVAALLRSIPLPDGRQVRSSGNFVLYDDMLLSVREDGPKATAYSLVGVILLCALVYRRPSRVLLVTGSLCLGVAWLGLAAVVEDLKINFLNFIALPITFGIGVDYTVNIFSRYLAEARDRPVREAVRATLASTGGAVVLCSLTTVIGYGSLLVARNGALISFGKIAIIGELTTLVAALLVLPAWIHAWGRPEGSAATTPPAPGNPGKVAA